MSITCSTHEEYIQAVAEIAIARLPEIDQRKAKDIKMMTPVIFKMEGHDVLAVFPSIPADVRGLEATCYAHVGQHGGAVHRYWKNLKPAKPEQYADLLRELEGQGYDDLKVYRRETKAMRQEARAMLARLK